MHSLAVGRSREYTDTESENEYLPPRGTYTPSAESLSLPRFGQSESSTPTFLDQQILVVGEQYPAWTAERQIPISKEEVCPAVEFFLLLKCCGMLIF